LFEMRTSLVIAVALLAWVCLADVSCTPEIESSDGNTYKFDLSGLKHKVGEQDLVARDDMNTYYMNICGQVSEASTAECSGAAVCQLTIGGDHNNAGSLNSQSFKENNKVDAGKGITVVYDDGKPCSSGDTRATTIYIECDEDVNEPIFKTVEETTHCSYIIHMISKHGCPTGTSSPGETAALVILLILIFGLILYFAIGAFYQKKFKDASTFREYVIHNQFWFSLPLLVKDGVLFIAHGFKKGDYVSV